MLQVARKLMLSALAMFGAAVLAQSSNLPAPSRSVYKCETNGKVIYTDEPCLGAKRVEVQPTRGLDKSSGRAQVGADVARERRREAFAEGLRPVTGMTPEQFEKAGQRTRLTPQAQRECRTLDVEVPRAEAAEGSATGTDLAIAQRQLLMLRKRQRELRC